MCVDTERYVCDHTQMQTHSFASFVYPPFETADLERIVGMKPALVRDWRRRGLIHEKFARLDGGFNAPTAAELLLLKRASDHGLGPKRLFGWSRAHGGKVLRHALDDPAAWATLEAWEAWTASQVGSSAPERFLAVFTPPTGPRAFDDLARVLEGHDRDFATVIDLRRLGRDLRESAGRPLADVQWSYGVEVA